MLSNIYLHYVLDLWFNRRLRKRGQKPKGFIFLGFTHYCGKTRRGAFKVKSRMSGKSACPVL
ncbi:MAG: hypothetical protein P8X90_18610 [Desulfobacterales bacterium]